MDRLRRGLYLVTPDWGDSERLLRVTEAALQGGAVCIQYRNKIAGSELRLEQASALVTLARRYDAAILINDDAKLAVAVHADGVHIGRDDGDAAQLRKTLAAGIAIGVSCYNEFSRAEVAAKVGAAYIAFGAMFPSLTKPQAVAAPLDLIVRAKQELDVAVACIGGITADNAAPLVAAGADWLAVINDIYQCDDPKARARQFAALWR